MIRCPGFHGQNRRLALPPPVLLAGMDSGAPFCFIIAVFVQSPGVTSIIHHGANT
ncbi:MAG: hypothetical protein FWF53_11550 [Candidatus Azobacteroides sp.]|nr:hypothetical protein [Candidatus Azobacteroides sp.]